MIKLKYHTLGFYPWGVRTWTGDGSCDGIPHDIPHYHVISHRCGYHDDVLKYCQEHEFCHAFVAEKMCDAPSFVLDGLCKGYQADKGLIIYEEAITQMFQRWLRANERPIISGGKWSHWKEEALDILDKEYIIES